MTNPTDGQICRVITRIDAVFTYRAYSVTTAAIHESTYTVAGAFDELIEKADAALNPEESDDLWSKIQDWADDNWEDVVDVPLDIHDFADKMIPSAAVTNLILTRSDIEISARAVGVDLAWNASAGQWQQLMEDGEPVTYTSGDERLIGHSIFYPTTLDITKVNHNQPDGIWYWVMSLRDAFLTLKSRLESNRIDAYDVMKPLVENAAPDGVEVIWLGFDDEEAGQ